MTYDEKIKELNNLLQDCNKIIIRINSNRTWALNDFSRFNQRDVGHLDVSDEKWIKLCSNIRTYFRINPDPVFSDRFEQIAKEATNVNDDVISSLRILINDLMNELKVRRNHPDTGDKNDTKRDIDLKQNPGKKVFIVHGHDELTLLKVKDFITSIGLEPVILKEKASYGLPIILKLEKYTDVIFAIILYTACDKGRAKDAIELKSRARQNVVLEHGLLYGKLGRERVVALLEKGVEQPSDLDGVVYIPLDEFEGWQTRLVREMNQCDGIDVSIR